jgi:hypothetical protein
MPNKPTLRNVEWLIGKRDGPALVKALTTSEGAVRDAVEEALERIDLITRIATCALPSLMCWESWAEGEPWNPSCE